MMNFPPPQIEVRFLHCVSHRVGLALWGLPNPAEPGRREGGVRFGCREEREGLAPAARFGSAKLAAGRSV